ncbi:hypothetical protein Tco_0807467 [Tanacetum coccineum]
MKDKSRTTEEKTDTSNALDALDANIRPTIYNDRGQWLRWVPTGKTFASSTTKVESEPPNGSNADITNQCESKQALNVSSAPFLNDKMMSDHNSSDLAPQRQEMSVENVSSGLVPQGQKRHDYDYSDPFLYLKNLQSNTTSALWKTTTTTPNASFQEAEFINPFVHWGTRNWLVLPDYGNNDRVTDVHKFQPQSHDPMDSEITPLEQVRGNPTNAVQTRRQRATILKCYVPLTVMDVKTGYSKGPLKRRFMFAHQKGSLNQIIPEKVYLLRKALYGLKQAPISRTLATKPKLDVDLSGEPVDQSDYLSKNQGPLMILDSSRPYLCKQYAIVHVNQALQHKSTSRRLKESLNT